jgi:cAMP-dependent protein kinase regulator
MDPYERTKLGDALIEEKFYKDSFVIKEGQQGDKFYLILEGTAIATKVLNGGPEPSKVMEYSKGKYFGERALLTNEQRAANIVVTSESLECLSLERDTF